MTVGIIAVGSGDALVSPRIWFCFVTAHEGHMPGLLDNPRHWYSRAKEARLLAQRLTDEEACRIMLGVAETYERLAELAQQRGAADDN